MLAERLSADPACRVTVVEAGPGPGDTAVRALTANGLQLPIGAASPVARWEAAQDYAVVANLRQERVRLEPLAALLLPLLDGQHDRAALAAHLLGLIEKGDLQLKLRDRPVAYPPGPGRLPGDGSRQ